MDIIKSATIRINRQKAFQTIDGFGVNINSKYWRGGYLKPVVDLLLHDLGATLFRLDGYGRSDWMDPDSKKDPSVLTRREFDAVYRTQDFQNARGMSLYLNSQGIQPYITLSGVVPKWMCDTDGKTLSQFALFADMAADYAHWLRQEGVNFRLFGPLNETDIGPPEGPFADPCAYAAACEALVLALDACGLQDMKLVAAEQAYYTLDYVREILKSESLRERIGVFGVHTYGDVHMGDLPGFVAAAGSSARCWMTEFGDLDQSDEREFRIAWVSMERLFRLLSDGLQGAMTWDAFDNFHDHDETWTTYGLIENSWNTFIPKKRYYAMKHVYRYVRPGFRRIEASCDLSDLQVLGFTNESTDELTVVGMNPTDQGVHVDLNLGLGAGQCLGYLDYDVYRTNEFEDCARVTTPVIKLKHAVKGVECIALPHSIFTITNVTGRGDRA